MANRALPVLAAVVFAPAIALAQAGPPAGPPPPAPSATPSATASGAPATGYAPSNKPQKTARSYRATPAKQQQPDDVLPGFEELSDGGSRLFVELMKTVPVEEQRAPGTITYVLRGMHVKLRNNRNALITVHFNTPVFRARLVPHGKDTHFVVELRANVIPTWRVAPGKDGTSVLQVDFPKGDYLPGAPMAIPAPTATAPAPAPSSSAR